MVTWKGTTMAHIITDSHLTVASVVLLSSLVVHMTIGHLDLAIDKIHYPEVAMGHLAQVVDYLLLLLYPVAKEGRVHRGHFR